MTNHPNRSKATATANLEGLLDYLQRGIEWKGAPKNCRDPGVDWTDLPTFGGSKPTNTIGVWSWDKTRLLIGTCAEDLQIAARRDML